MKRGKCEYVRPIFLLILNSFSVCQCLNALDASNDQKCLSDQSSYLLQLKQEFAFDKPVWLGGYPKMKSWRAGSDCCSWDGVTCNMETGKVIGLSLSNSWLHGPITSNSSLFNLRHLQNLSLSANNFIFSTIPSEIGRLTRLKHLHLSLSNLSGQIPIEISNLTKLISLGLTSPLIGFYGEFPIDIFYLPNLETINLSGNPSLKGTLPQFGNGSSLTFLYLVSTSFTGKLPDSLGNLSKLTELDLSMNVFSDQLPSSLGNLPNLAYLSLRFNRFTGQIPSSLGNLAKLEYLDFTFNIFNGRIPTSFANLSQLTSLILTDNNLHGHIPSVLGNLTQLKYFWLNLNQFNGSIPSDISRIPNLELLVLSANQLTGVIPSSLIGMPSLFELFLDQNQLTGFLDFDNVSSSPMEHLNLGENQLNGPIPRSILKLVNLSFLSISFNNIRVTQGLDLFFGLKHLLELHLSGINLSVKNITLNSTLPQFHSLILSSCNISEFPDFLRFQNELEHLDLSNCNIEGQVPKWFWNTGTETLTHLNLSHNAFSSLEQPTTILPWKRMDVLDLHSNKLQGSLPIPSPTTTAYFVSDNKFFGKLPPSICQLSSVQFLDLSNNNLNGTIPTCLGNFSNMLAVLKLKGNNFQGILPQTFINGNLQTLDLSQNWLQGKLPRSLVHCEKLEVLNIGYNHIYDTFPFWLKTLPDLKVLILRSNNFHGSIQQLGTKFVFVQLHIIDVSHNNFSGNLSGAFFGTLKAMTLKQDNTSSQQKYIGANMPYYTDSVALTIKKNEIVLERILSIFMTIDLSNNRFQGEIPDTIGNLKELVALNLSSNAFTGHIPSSMENLTELESLDVSRNRLSGEIPPQLASLTFLEVLDLSHNQLVGPIPQGRQIVTFPESSFDGNAGLCGFPLPKKCGDIDTGKQSPTSQQDSESTVKIDRTAMLIGCGCGLLNGVITGWIVSSRMGWFAKHSTGKRRRRRPIRPLR